MAVNIGVIKMAPVDSKFPPDGASNHRYVPPGAVAVKVAVAPEQIVVPAAVGATGGGLTVTKTAALGPVHPLTVAWT